MKLAGGFRVREDFAKAREPTSLRASVRSLKEVVSSEDSEVLDVGRATLINNKQSGTVAAMPTTIQRFFHIS